MVEAKRSPEEIIKRADKSMYANKIAKRNGQLQRR
jgi:PleD family two-component response regulator